ncbi:MAG: hypothetical protein P4L84_18090 [Isosphaeraceae bacterium]|nr:hypothetical protein [Isosphaeraceae bacterium]
MTGDGGGASEGREGEIREAGARPFVWSIWLLLTLGAAGFVARYGTDVPYWDDYALLDQMVGAAPITIEWLWAQHNEHRISVPKLALLVVHRLAGNDVRAAMVLNVAMLSALAAALIRLASLLPGGGRPSDAFFPLLLHFGHGANLLWSFQLGQVLPTCVGASFLLPIAARSSWPHPAYAILACVGLTMLPLSRGTGLMYVPAVALWMVGWALAEFRQPRVGRVRRSALIALSALPGVALTALYFRGFQKGLHPAVSDGIASNARVGLQFLTSGLGMTTARGWPWTGLVTVALVALASFFLVRAWVLEPEERPRVYGLVAFLAAPLGLAAGVGWGRGWAGELAGFQERYVAMATPLWAWVALVVRLYGTAAVGQFVPNALFVGLCVLAWPNSAAGLERAREGAATAEALARDLRAGVPTYRIIRRYTPFLHPSQDEMSRLLPKLRDGRIGPFKDLHNSPVFREVPVALQPTLVSDATWDGRTARVTDIDPQITFSLSKPREVAGIRIRYSHANRQGAPARFQLTWRRPGQRGYSLDQRYANWNLPTGSGRETTVWVDDVIADFRIQPDSQPCDFKIDAIELLVP